jgi:predicted ATPase
MSRPDRLLVRLDRRPVAAGDRPRQLEAVLDRPLHQRHEPFGRNPEPHGCPLQRHEVVRGEDRARVVERPVAVGQLERPQSQRLRELSRNRQRVGGLAADRRPGAVELSGIAAPVERLERVEREAALVRGERSERRRAGDVSHPGTSRGQTPGHAGNGHVRDAEEDDVGVVLAHADAALAEAGGDGRTDAARTDDVGSLDHDLAPAPNRMPGTADCTRAARRGMLQFMADVPKPRVTLLGGFASEAGGVPVPDSAWRLRKAKELVKLLALTDGSRLHREQAMDALWPDRDPAAAANNLNQAVHAARKALGAEAISVHEGLLRLDADLDVDAFELAAADARRERTAQACERALALYGGELLPENRYDDWAEPERARLAALRDELEQMLGDLGVVAGRRRIRLETSTFVGREHELAELRTLLGRTRLLTLAGTGGAGKTRLALELARSREDAHADGALLVELDSVAEGSDVPDAVAEALDLRALPGGALVDAIAADLAPRELLLVLDNCEHVIGASAAIADALLRSAPRLTILATSREPLRVPGEVVFRVPSLAIPDPDAAEAPAALLGYEAVRLFVERARAVAPGFQLDESNGAAVARICHRLDGLPLALELAAARTDALAADALAERLDDRFRLLRAGSRTAPTRQQTLEAALHWSYELLAAVERVLLRRLAVFSGGFTLEAAEEVCAGDGVEPTEVADLLARLVEKSLVTTEERQGARRYRLLETIRAYADARLAEVGEREAVAARHAAWLARLVERADSQLLGLDVERGNLRAALETLLSRDPPAALGLCARVWPFWLRRIELPEARRWLGEALERAPEPSPVRVRALLGHAAVEYRSGSGDERLGLDHADEALALARELGEPELEWRAVHFRGGIEIAREDGRAAAGHYEAALAVARDHRLEAPEAVSVYSLGVAAWVAGDFAAAEERLAESDGLFAGLGDPDETVPALLNVAQIAVQDPGAPGLRLVFEDTLLPFAEVTAAVAAGYVVLNWANVARAADDPARARGLLAEALDRFERVGSERGRADVWARLANLALAEGDLAEAAELFERVRGIRTRRGDRRGAALALVGLGHAAVAAGDYVRAEALLGEAADTFRRAGDRWGLASTLWRTAELEQARDRLDRADELLEQALDVVEETPNRRWQAVTWAHLAEVALLRGEDGRARELLEHALDAFASRDDTQGVEYVRARLRKLAKHAQTAGKGGPARTGASKSTRRRNE